jgi:hypothetical protein
MVLLQPVVHSALTLITPTDPVMTAPTAPEARVASSGLATDRGISARPVPAPSRRWLAPTRAANWLAQARASDEAPLRAGTRDISRA